ncbi:MAG TPA: hypothetical protein VGS23_02400 [Thermoplasmata archaeon]|nr:hypothetical protein [Thermoplasmata archaeon]
MESMKRMPTRSRGRRLQRCAVSLLLVVGLVLPLSAIPSQAPLGRARAGASGGAADTGTPQILLMVSSSNTLVPNNVTVWGSTAEFFLTNNDSEPHEIVFSSKVDQPVTWTTSATNTSGSWFAPPNVLAAHTVGPASTLQFALSFPSAGTYQFVDRAYFNMPPYDSSGNISVHSLPSPAASNPTENVAGSNSLYLLAGLGGGFLIGVGVALAVVILRRRK